MPLLYTLPCPPTRASQLIAWENNLQRYQEKSIAASFIRHLRHLNRRFPTAADLLKVMAYLNTENISLEVLGHGAAAVSTMRTLKLPASGTSLSVKTPSFANKWKAKLRIKPKSGKHRIDAADRPDVITVTMSSLLDLIQSPTQLNEALMELQNRSLIGRRQEAGHSSMWMHRLIQIVVLEDMKSSGKDRDWFDNAAELMCRALAQIPEPSSREALRRCQDLVPHIQSLTMYKAVPETARMAFMLTNGIEVAKSYMANHGRYDDMHELNRHYVLWTSHLYGSTDTKTLVAMQCLGASHHSQGHDHDAEQMLDSVILTQKEHFGLENHQTLLAMQSLAYIYDSRGRHQDAEHLLLQVVKHREKFSGSEHDDTLNAMQDLASVYESQVRYTDAEHLLNQVRRCHEKQFGLEHDRTFSTMRGLAGVYKCQGRYREAEHILGQVLRCIETRVGLELACMFNAMLTLAAIYYFQGRYEDAEKKLGQVLRHNREQFGLGHFLTFPPMNNLAMVYMAQGRYKDAQQLFEEIFDCYKKLDHINSSLLSTLRSTILLNLASLRESQGRYQDACDLIPLCFTHIQHLSQEHPRTLAVQHLQSSIYRRQGRYDEAEKICDQVLLCRQRQLGQDHDDTLWTMHQLACIYRDQGRLHEAVELFREVHLKQQQQPELGSEHVRTVATMHELASVYLLQERYSEAHTVLAKVLAWRDESLGRCHPHTRQTLELLAQAYRQLDRLDEAELISRRLDEST